MNILKKINKRNIRRILKLATLEDLTGPQRKLIWPEAKTLGDKHITNCKLLPDRISIIKKLPKKSICAELGIASCVYSKQILNENEPKEFHLFDISNKCIDIAKTKFQKEINDNVVFTHKGDSSLEIGKFKDEYFDWIYIDGDHSYDGCKKDLMVAKDKIKEFGTIICNDYIYFSPNDFQKYGVVESVNEFCIKYNFEIIFMSLDRRMYNDVALRKIKNN